MARLAVLSALASLGPLAGCPGAAQPRDALRCGARVDDALAPCPSDAALAAHLRDRWALPASATLTTRCVPGRFGTAGWIVRAVVEDGGPSRVATFVLQPSCGALTDAGLRQVPPGDEAFEAIDLDGDHVDEVVVRASEVEASGTSTSLLVLRVGGGRLVRSGKVRLTYDGVDPALPGGPSVHCTGAVRYLNHPDGGLLVEIDATRSADSELCLASGRHRFELGAHGLRRAP